jgi:hypothetical protein
LLRCFVVSLFHCFIVVFVIRLTRKITNRAQPEKSVCDNWLRATTIDLLVQLTSGCWSLLTRFLRLCSQRERLRGRLDDVLGGAAPGTSAHRLWKLQQSFQGVGQRDSYRGPKPARGLPVFVGRYPTHSRVALTLQDKYAIAHALSTSLGAVIDESHINPTAEVFTGRAFVNDMRRTTEAFDRNAVRSGGSVNSHFVPLPGRTVVPNAVVGTIVAFYRVSLAPSAPPGLNARYELVLADLHHTLAARCYRDSSFGYCTFDIRLPQRVFVESSGVGPPVGIVRSPRLGHPKWVYWIIHTHWTNKLRHHLDN